MPDEQGRQIVREIADVIATATDFGRRRDNGEAIPHHEQVHLQQRKVDLLRAISRRTPRSIPVRNALAGAEEDLRQLTAAPVSVPATPPQRTADGLSHGY